MQKIYQKFLIEKIKQIYFLILIIIEIDFKNISAPLSERIKNFKLI